MTITAAQSIAGVLQKVGAVGKDSKNQQQGFNYRGIDAVVNAVHPALAEVGGFIVPRMVSQEVEHAQTKNGGAMTVIRLVAEYAWYGTEGDPIVGRVSSEAFDTADKATAKAWSVAYRTFLLQTLNLPTDDPDPDSQYIERGNATTIEQSTGRSPSQWLAEVAAAADGVELTELYTAAHTAFSGAIPDPLMKALNARRKELSAAAAEEAGQADYEAAEAARFDAASAAGEINQEENR